jgi:AcrR family transcriptional regulator
MPAADWTNFQAYILQLEQEGKVTRTFRRLDSTRQQAVINAILEEATEKGPTSLNIKEVARRADVSVGSLYQYFPNRDGLLDFALELCVRYMTEMFEMSRPYLAAMPLREALSAYLTVGVEWGKTETGLVRFFGRAAYQGDPALAGRLVRPVAEAMRKITFEMLEGAVQRGEIRPDVDLEAAARIVNALLIAAGDSQLLPYLNTYLQVSDESVPFERVVDGLVGLITRGLGGPEGA